MTPPVQRSERDEIIEGILASHSGIFGTEVCQLCGRLGNFAGYNTALISHFAASEFTALDHGHPHDLERRAELLRRQAHRYCEVCQTKVPRSSAPRAGSHWLCDACAGDPAHRDEDASYPLRDLVRRRYLEGVSDIALARPPAGWAGYGVVDGEG